MIAVFCVVSWRIFWLTMLNRSDPQAAPGLILTEEERLVLDRAVKAKRKWRQIQTLCRPT